MEIDYSNNPEYQKAIKEIEKLEGKLEVITRSKSIDNLLFLSFLTVSLSTIALSIIRGDYSVTGMSGVSCISSIAAIASGRLSSRRGRNLNRIRQDHESKLRSFGLEYYEISHTPYRRNLE